MSDFRTFEKKIISIVLDTLQSYIELFEEKEITHDKPEVKMWKSSPEEYESEFRVSFYKDSKFLDIIECHIFRGGKKIAKSNEFQVWINETIEDMIKNI